MARLSSREKCFECFARTGVYKPVRTKHSEIAPVQESLAIIVDSEFSRYKDGTRSTCALAFLKGSQDQWKWALNGRIDSQATTGSYSYLNASIGFS